LRRFTRRCGRLLRSGLCGETNVSTGIAFVCNDVLIPSTLFIHALPDEPSLSFLPVGLTIHANLFVNKSLLS
jgi:hypothetical protein